MSYYHLSPLPGLAELRPVVPREGGPARVCAAPTVRGCLRALPPERGFTLSVYEVEEAPDVIGPLVWDASITGEVWFTRAVRAREVRRGTRKEIRDE